MKEKLKVALLCVKCKVSATASFHSTAVRHNTTFQCAVNLIVAPRRRHLYLRNVIRVIKSRKIDLKRKSIGRRGIDVSGSG
jgi:hypothetical protein